MPAPPHRANQRSEGLEGGENGANRGLFFPASGDCQCFKGPGCHYYYFIVVPFTTGTAEYGYLRSFFFC